MLHFFIAAFSSGPPLSLFSLECRRGERKERRGFGGGEGEVQRSRLPEVEVERQEGRPGRTSDRQTAGGRGGGK